MEFDFKDNDLVIVARPCRDPHFARPDEFSIVNKVGRLKMVGITNSQIVIEGKTFFVLQEQLEYFDASRTNNASVTHLLRKG